MYFLVCASQILSVRSHFHVLGWCQDTSCFCGFCESLSLNKVFNQNSWISFHTKNSNSGIFPSDSPGFCGSVVFYAFLLKEGFLTFYCHVNGGKEKNTLFYFFFNCNRK